MNWNYLKQSNLFGEAWIKMEPYNLPNTTQKETWIIERKKKQINKIKTKQVQSAFNLMLLIIWGWEKISALTTVRSVKQLFLMLF